MRRRERSWISLNSLGNTRYVLVNRSPESVPRSYFLMSRYAFEILIGRAIVNIEHMLTGRKGGKITEREAIVLGYAM